MSNVSSLSSPIANLSTNTPAKRDRKRKSDVEKVDYKKRRITYNKKRNFWLPITETEKNIHWQIEIRNVVRVKVYILQMSISQKVIRMILAALTVNV